LPSGGEEDEHIFWLEDMMGKNKEEGYGSADFDG
jgi:hypothetical protein